MNRFIWHGGLGGVAGTISLGSVIMRAVRLGAAFDKQGRWRDVTDGGALLRNLWRDGSGLIELGMLRSSVLGLRRDLLCLDFYIFLSLYRMFQRGLIQRAWARGQAVQERRNGCRFEDRVIGAPYTCELVEYIVVLALIVVFL